MGYPITGALIAAGVLAGFAPASAGGGGGIAVEYAEKAITRGHGSMCSLAMEPVDAGGYYPCLDFGPYRYVRGYGKVMAFVVLEKAAPFQVMGGSAESPVFTVAGPWETDLPMRAVAYWNDEVEGGLERRKEARAADVRRGAAERYVNSLVEKERPPPPARPEVKGPAPSAAPEQEIGAPVDPADLREALEAVAR